jgi:membrane-bound serine protease (ClpP class)
MLKTLNRLFFFNKYFFSKYSFYILLFFSFYLFFYFKFINFTFSAIDKNVKTTKKIYSNKLIEIDKDDIKVMVLNVDGIISNPLLVYIQNKLKNKDKYDFILIKIDSVGGLLNSMMDLVSLFYSVDKPIICYVYPKGSKALSAAMFVLIAGNVSVMANDTITGASTPLDLTNTNNQTLQNKAIQALLAFSQNLANRRNKNYSAIEDAIINAKTYTSLQALNHKLIDFVLDDPNDIFQNIKNKPIILDTGEVVILKNYKNIIYDNVNPDILEKILIILANPELAYFLLTLGFWAIIIELNHPGTLIPLIVGIILISLGLFGLGLVSVNFLGIALIIASFIIFIIEIKANTYGISFIIGTLLLVSGTILAFKNSNIYYKPPVLYFLALSSIFLITFLTIIYYIFKSLKNKPKFGVESLIGKKAKVINIKENELIVKVDGDLWSASLENPSDKVNINDYLIITNLDLQNLKLILKKEESQKQEDNN